MNQLTDTIELAKKAGIELLGPDQYSRVSYWAALDGELEAFRALIVAERDKELLGVGMEPVAWRHSHTYSLHDLEHEVQLADADASAEPLYTADQLASARLQDQQRIAELEAKELDLYKQLAVAKLSAMNGWQRYEQARRHRKELLEAQLAERKPLTDEQMFEMAEIAWRHGWGSCRDAEYVGEEAEDERWGMVGAEVVQDIAAHEIGKSK